MASNGHRREESSHFELEDDLFVADEDESSIFELTGVYQADDEAVPIDLCETFPEDRRSRGYGSSRKQPSVIDAKAIVVGYPEIPSKDGTHSIDPMNIYLREMGSLTLLSHEEELKLAKMMEEGKRRIQNAVFKTPLAIPALVEVSKDLGVSKENICNIINGVSEDQPELIAREARLFLENVERATELDRLRAGPAEKIPHPCQGFSRSS